MTSVILRREATKDPEMGQYYVYIMTNRALIEPVNPQWRHLSEQWIADRQDPLRQGSGQASLRSG